MENREMISVFSKLAEYLTQADLAPIQKEVDAFGFDEAKTQTYALAEKLGLNLAEPQ